MWTSETPRWQRQRWFMPSFCALLGALAGGAHWLGGNPAQGLISLALLCALGALFLFATGSETLQGLAGPGRDERWAAIDLTAVAASGSTVLLAITGCWLWELAHGRGGNPYGLLMAVSGASYAAAVVWQRARG